ncbi:MAG: NAD-dependent dehydratase [Pseudonocardiales bacterium]|nr:MAG: NAD-dependent dehydratase [Pseudonocardiales bacterium]
MVAVTGAGRGIGADVAIRLAGMPGMSVVGVDDVVAAEAGAAVIAWRQVNPGTPAVVEAFAGADAVVHLALDLAPQVDRAAQRRLNATAARATVTASSAAGVRRLVLVTSAMVYGARADNPVPIDDNAPLRAVPEASVLGDLLEIEALARTSAKTYRGLAVTVLRPAIVLGPGARSAAAAQFDAPRLLRIRGHATKWQFCHVDDLASAIAVAVAGGIDGAANVASPGWLEQADVERIAGRSSIELPARIATATAERLHRLALTPALPSELDYLMHPWVVDPARLRAAGWSPSRTNADALADYVGSRDRHSYGGLATRGAAAGATVALIGTAALVRRARRRRS